MAKYLVKHRILHDGKSHSAGKIVDAEKLGGDESVERLVKSGYLQPVDDTPASDAPVADLTKLTKEELVVYAKAHGLDVSASGKKEDIIAAITTGIAAAASGETQ